MWFNEVVESVLGDIMWAVLAVILIVAYCATTLGSCSPVHCRLTLALIGICCVLLSVAAGFGICYIYDWKGTEMTNIIPILMLGIGVDDMFVICNAID